jgi:hypothetical protein
MELRQIISATAARLIRLEPVYYLPALIQQVRERYGFVQYPNTPQEILSADSPLSFFHGKFVDATGRLILIRSLKLAGEGVAVETIASTHDADAAMEDLLDWAHREMKVTINSPGGWYISQVEVKLNASMDDWFPAWKRIGALISGRHETRPAAEGASPIETPSYQPYSFSMYIDPSKGVKIPCAFQIERRATVPYSENVYFSAAPLSTDEHLELLAEIERSMGGGPNPPTAP